MAGPLAAPIIGAVGNLLGGLFGRSKGKSASSQSYGNVKGLVQASRAWGINLLTLLGGGVSGGSGIAADNSALGQGIANAAMLASDALASKRSTAAALNAYQQQNQRLQERLNAVTLRAPVPGVYGTARMPSNPEVYGGQAAGLVGVAVSDGGGGGPAGGPPGTVTPSWADPRREQDVMKTTNDSAIAVVDNPNFHNRAFAVPAFNGEILDLGQTIVLGGSILYDKALQRAERREAMSRSMTVGDPLTAPPGFVNRTWELLPGYKPKGKPYTKPRRYGVEWVR